VEREGCGYSKGGTRLRSCCPRAGNYAPGMVRPGPRRCAPRRTTVSLTGGGTTLASRRTRAHPWRSRLRATSITSLRCRSHPTRPLAHACSLVHSRLPTSVHACATALASRRTCARHSARAYVHPRPLACAAVCTLLAPKRRRALRISVRSCIREMSAQHWRLSLHILRFLPMHQGYTALSLGAGTVPRYALAHSHGGLWGGSCLTRRGRIP
jgi:hypothetical protein